MMVTEFGMLMLFKFEQYSKARLPITLVALGLSKQTLFRLSQLQNAKSPIVPTELGMLTLISLLH